MLSNIMKAAEYLEVPEDNLKEFEVLDTFNNIELKGVICRRSDYRYGSMVLFEVDNEIITPQIIYGTPKLHYPFDKKGVFHWPKIKQVQLWDKLDGTNILAYHYWNKEGTRFLTYKTRLGPVLSDTVYGPFLSMWKELLTENKWIEDVIDNNLVFNLSFELYGTRNPITIYYDISLATKLLFGVDRFDYSIVPPNRLNINCLIDTCIPKRYNFTVDDVTELYQFVRTEMSKSNCNGLIQEGVVFYADIGERSWKMFKCKPEEIEKIHWAASGIIQKRAIWNTIINAFEDIEPDLEYILELLKEEYSDKMIFTSKPRIKNIFRDVLKHMQDTKRINDAYVIAKENGFDLSKDKAETFRFLSKYFKKEEMKKVGTVLLR